MELVLLVEDDDERAAQIKRCVPQQLKCVHARSAGAAIGILSAGPIHGDSPRLRPISFSARRPAAYRRNRSEGDLRDTNKIVSDLRTLSKSDRRTARVRDAEASRVLGRTVSMVIAGGRAANILVPRSARLRPVCGSSGFLVASG
jgi:hypothetical protein